CANCRPSLRFSFENSTSTATLLRIVLASARPVASSTSKPRRRNSAAVANRLRMSLSTTSTTAAALAPAVVLLIGFFPPVPCPNLRPVMRAFERTVTHILIALRHYLTQVHMGTCRVGQCPSVQHRAAWRRHEQIHPDLGRTSCRIEVGPLPPK